MLSGRFSLFIFLALSIGCSFGAGEQKTKKPAENGSTKVDSTGIIKKSDSAAVQLKYRSFLFNPTKTRQISKYDHLIKKYSRRFGFDWRLIAAQIFAESHFLPNAKSHVGALGLMQIMPGTAKHMGIDPNLLLKPEHNISLGCLYDRRLYRLWKDKEGKDRLAFTFASYNAGRRKVLRASSRAPQPRSWIKVVPHLPRETRRYVSKIFNQYEIYKKKHF